MTVLIFLGGLMGAAGVALLAAAAHAAPGAGLDSAGQILLFHAAAVLGATAVVQNSLAFRPLALAAVVGFVVGALLFSGDLTLRALSGHRLFPYAAPTGGTVLIVGWLGLALAAVISWARGSR